VTFDSDGRQVLADLGNTYGEIVSDRYEDGTKRLINVSLDRQGVAGTGVNLNYAYDAAGNMVSIKDQPTAASVSGVSHQDNQCFGFDGLQRLQLAFTALGGDCSVANDGVTVDEVGGVAPYWSDYSYDALGNRTQLVNRATGGATSTSTTNYTHGAGAAGPHQVTGVAKTAGATTTTSAYVYDDAGNRDSRTTAGVTVDYLWDAEGELAGVDGEQYTYAANGNRLVRKDASGTTVYLPGGQEITIGAPSVTATRYYSFAGQTVAMRTGKGMAAVSSLVSDQHGSVVAAVANTAVPSTTTVQRLYSDPFGAARGGSGANVPGDHRFLGAVRDSGSGLTLLGARYYDEAVGQFISVDPLLESGVPAQFNAYCYSGNNPVTFSDPSGLMWDPGWGAPGSPSGGGSGGGSSSGSGKTPIGGASKTPGSLSPSWPTRRPRS
jgi:RHS repeat-associated protein